MTKNLFKFSLILLLLATSGLAARAQAKSDLIVARASIAKDTEGFVKSVAVTITNFCQASAAKDFQVRVLFKRSADKDAKNIYFASREVVTLEGGASRTLTFDFDITDIKIGAGRHLLVEVDPFNKVSEASEDNNWRTLNPNGAPSKLSSQWQCSPKM
jgi:hypothetical protein